MHVKGETRDRVCDHVGKDELTETIVPIACHHESKARRLKPRFQAKKLKPNHSTNKFKSI